MRLGDTDDVVGAATDAGLTLNAGVGEDVYVITRYQHGTVTILDGAEQNVVKFDFGVTITGFAEVAGFGGIRSVTLTLSTGATVIINSPAEEIFF